MAVLRVAQFGEREHLLLRPLVSLADETQRLVRRRGGKFPALRLERQAQAQLLPGLWGLTFLSS